MTSPVTARSDGGAMVTVIGGGLAGTEASWQIASRGLPVALYEMRPVRTTRVHRTDRLAELVCSNSFRGAKLENAVGLLKEEMRRLGSLVMRVAARSSVPAGGALAVDRDRFAAGVTEAIEQHPLITVHRQEVPHLPVADEPGRAGDRRYRSPDLGFAIGRHCDAGRSRASVLLRCDQPGRARRDHRPLEGLSRVAMGPRRVDGRRGRLPQLPAEPDRVPDALPSLGRGRARHVARLRRGAVLRGLSSRSRSWRGVVWTRSALVRSSRSG